MPADPLRRRLLKDLPVPASARRCCHAVSDASSRRPGNVDFALRQIRDGIFVLQGTTELTSPANQGAIANLGVVVGRDAVAVIDSGGSLVEARALIEAIAETTSLPVRYLVNTHMHPDHIFGNAAFRDIGATIVGHRNLPRALAARGAFYLQNFREQLGDELMQGIEIVAPTMLVSDRLDLDLGGRVLELRAWKAAHTDNDVTIYDAASHTLFAGDLVFMQHLPTLDGSLLGWLRQMDALAAIDAARVVPGHGPASADWPEALDARSGVTSRFWRATFARRSLPGDRSARPS